MDMKKFVFETKEQYLDIIKAWKNSCKDKNFSFTAEHFALYAIIRGKDPKKCFATPEQQSDKKLIAKNETGNETYNRCMGIIFRGYLDKHLLLPFRGKLTADDLVRIREHWKNSKDAA